MLTPDLLQWINYSQLFGLLLEKKQQQLLDLLNYGCYRVVMLALLNLLDRSQ